MPKKIYPWEFWAIPKFIQADKRLSATDKDVISVMITRMNGENFLRVKQETIAEDLAIAVRSVKRSVERLEKLKLINVDRVGNHICNRYNITLG